MYIACPNCYTNFIVLPEQIGEFGKKVKCSKCYNIWHQKPGTQFKPTMIKAQAPEGSLAFGSGVNLPALLPVKIPQYLYTLPLALTGLIIILSVILFPSYFGIAPLRQFSALTIQDVEIENHQDIGKIIISYKILNAASCDLALPLVRFRLFDKNYRLLKSYLEDKSTVHLVPSQYVKIKTEFSSVPAATEQIDITLGSKLDFILR